MVRCPSQTSDALSSQRQRAVSLLEPPTAWCHPRPHGKGHGAAPACPRQTVQPAAPQGSGCSPVNLLHFTGLTFCMPLFLSSVTTARDHSQSRRLLLPRDFLVLWAEPRREDLSRSSGDFPPFLVEPAPLSCPAASDAGGHVRDLSSALQHSCPAAHNPCPWQRIKPPSRSAAPAPV